MEVRDKHLKKALLPMLVTLFGIFISFKPSSQVKAASPIRVIPSERMTVIGYGLFKDIRSTLITL